MTARVKKYMLALALLLLAACQSAPGLEDDARYVKLASVVDKHEYSEAERKQAQAGGSDDSSVSMHMGIGVGVGSRNSFGGMMFGMGGMMEERPVKRDEQPQIAKGAIRYTVQPLGSDERIEVMSYGQYKVGDCVKVLAGHPTEFSRFFELKPGERCK